jgi:hypothetical protein
MDTRRHIGDVVAGFETGRLPSSALPLADSITSIGSG